MGPLATTGQLDRIEKEVAFAQEQGARLLTGGRRPAGADPRLVSTSRPSSTATARRTGSSTPSCSARC